MDCFHRVSAFIHQINLIIFLFSYRGTLEAGTNFGTWSAIGYNNVEPQAENGCIGEIGDILGNIRLLMENSNYSGTPLQAYIVLMNDAHQVRTNERDVCSRGRVKNNERFTNFYLLRNILLC